jgi:hypothetical protein
MATPRAAPKRSGSSKGKWFFMGVLHVHETVPLQVFYPFTELYDLGHASSAEGSNAPMAGLFLLWKYRRSEGARRVLALGGPEHGFCAVVSC